MRRWTLNERKNSTAPSKRGLKHPIEWMKEGREEGGTKEDEQNTDWKSEGAQNEWSIDWLIPVPSFVREVEPLQKGGIQLLLQNKDILAHSWMNE